MATKPGEAMYRHPNAEAGGYPLHRITGHRTWTNDHGARFTKLTTACGRTEMGSVRWTPKDPRRARTGELCEDGCWS